MKFLFFKKIRNEVKVKDVLVFLELIFGNFFQKNKFFCKSLVSNYLGNVLSTNLCNLIPILGGFKIFINIFINFSINGFQLGELNFVKLFKKLFKKLTTTRLYSTKHSIKDFKYFWIFKKSGHYWKKNFLFYKNYQDDKSKNFSKPFLKFNFLKILKTVWTFHKKLFTKRITKKFNLLKIKYQKKKNHWNKLRPINLLKTPPFKYDDLQLITLTLSLNDFHNFFVEADSHLKILFKNFRKVRIKENTRIEVRKRFQSYYIYKTFEYGYHKYWFDYDYCITIDTYNFLNVLVLSNWNHSPIIVNDVKKFFLKKEFLKAIFWKKTKRFVRLDNRGFFFWERRSGRKKRKFRKMFLAKIMFNNTHFFWSDCFMGGFLRLFNNFNLFNSGVSLHNFNFDGFLNKLDELKNFLFFSQTISNLNFVKSYQNFFLKKSSVSNYSLFFLLPFAVKHLITKKRILIKNPINHKYFNNYFTNFVGFFSNMKPLFIFNTNEFFGDDFVNDCAYYCGEILTLFKKLNKKFFKQFQLTQFIELLFFSFLKKDLSFFIKFFKFILENMFLKKHKKVFYSFEFILKKFFIKMFYFTRVKGFRFEIAGKLSVTGNSKTRNKIISCGSYSLTNKNLKINYTQDTVRTTTGVLGIKTYLTY